MIINQGLGKHRVVRRGGGHFSRKCSILIGGSKFQQGAVSTEAAQSHETCPPCIQSTDMNIVNRHHLKSTSKSQGSGNLK